MEKIMIKAVLLPILIIGMNAAQASQTIVLTEKEMDKAVAGQGLLTSNPMELFSSGNVAAVAHSSSNAYVSERPVQMVVIADSGYSATVGLGGNGFNHAISIRISR